MCKFSQNEKNNYFRSLVSWNILHKTSCSIFYMKKLINFILILIAFSFLKPAPVLAAASNLRCTPYTGTFKVGDTFTVEYALDTRSFETFGTDVVALFDTAVIEATTAESVAVTDVNGWGQPSTNTVDNILG